MFIRSGTASIILLIFASFGWADIPGPGPRPRPGPPVDFRVPPPEPIPQPVRLVVSFDSSAKFATLVLPPKLSAALQPNESSRVATAQPGAIVGIAFAGSLIGLAVWLVRRPRLKVALGTLGLLASVTFIGLAVHAQPVRLDPPRATVETGKVRISRGLGNDLQLILPSRPK